MHSHIKEKHAADQAGFTLIEIMITVSILAIGLLALAAMQIKATEMNHAAMRLTEAGAIAQEQLEQLMALPIGNAALQDGNADINDPTEFDAPNNPEGYIVSWDVDQNNPNTGDRRIRVWVRWWEKGWYNARLDIDNQRETMLVDIRPQSMG